MRSQRLPLSKLQDVSFLLQLSPLICTTLDTCHSRLCVCHPFRHGLVAIICSRARPRHLEVLAFSHDARWHSLCAHLKANVCIGISVAVKLQHLGGTASILRSLALDACASRIVTAF